MMRSPWLRAELALGIVSLSLLVSAIVFPGEPIERGRSRGPPEE